FADLHNHLAPGVDDGAQTVAESLHHLTKLARDGVMRLAVSPHLNGALAHESGALRLRLDRLEAAYRELEAACRGRAGLPRLGFGQEILAADAETATAV